MEVHLFPYVIYGNINDNISEVVDAYMSLSVEYRHVFKNVFTRTKRSLKSSCNMIVIFIL
jgi:hypothetical protein